MKSSKYGLADLEIFSKLQESIHNLTKFKGKIFGILKNFAKKQDYADTRMHITAREVILEVGSHGGQSAELRTEQLGRNNEIDPSSHSIFPTNVTRKCRKLRLKRYVVARGSVDNVANINILLR